MGYINLIRQSLCDKGWSMRRLAAETGLSHAAISFMLSGKHEPSLKTLRAISAALEIPMADLVKEAPNG